MELTLSNGTIIDFNPGYPEDFHGPVLQGSISFFSSTNLAEIVIQELKSDLYSIRLVIGKIVQKIYSKGWIQSEGLYSLFMMQNGIRKSIDNLGKLHIRQGQYSGFYTTPVNCNASFDQKNEFQLLDFYFSPRLLEELTPFFPELKTILENSKSASIPEKINWSLPSMKEITQEILNCPYNENTRQFFYDLKIRELLLELLETSFKITSTTYRFTVFEIDRIHKARNILLNHISGKAPSLRTLARQVALNEFKLKKGFKQLFNVGMIEWLTEERMQLAKKLILTTNRPIKDICSEVGYPRTTNFITAFKRRFGMTPGSLRR